MSDFLIGLAASIIYGLIVLFVWDHLGWPVGLVALVILAAYFMNVAKRAGEDLGR